MSYQPIPNPLPVSGTGTFAVTGTFFQATQPVSGTVTANAGTGTFATSLAALPALVAGSAIVGKVGIDQTTPGTTNLVSIGTNGVVALGTGAAVIGAVTQSGTWNIGTVTTLPALPTGANTIGAVNLAQYTPVTGRLPVDGSGVMQPVSGTVTANAGTGTFATSLATAPALVAGAAIIGKVGIDQTTPGTTNLVSIGTSGTVTANAGTGTFAVSAAALPLPTGASTSANQPTAAALGSTTAGQTGNVHLGAVTTAAPTYVTGQSNALSLTIAGGLRTDGSGVTQPVSGTVTAAQATAASLNATVVGTGTFAVQAAQATAASLNATVVGTGTFAVQAAQSGAWNITNVSGTVSLPTGASTEASLAKLTLAQGAATSGQTGSLHLAAVTTAAPAYTTAQSSPLSLTTTGALRVDGSGITQTVSGTVTANAGTGTFATSMATAPVLVAGTAIIGKVGIDQTTPGTTNAVSVAQIGANTVLTGNGITGTGSQRVTIASDNTAFSVIATQVVGSNLTTGDTGAKTATGNGATQTNAGNKGVMLVLNLGTATGTAPTLVLKFQASVDGGTSWVDIPGATTAALIATGLFGIILYPGTTVMAGTTVSGTTAVASNVLPRTWRVVWTIGGTTPSFTITNIQYNYMVN